MSSAELNGKRCTVCRHLRNHESHALVEVEAKAMSFFFFELKIGGPPK